MRAVYNTANPPVAISATTGTAPHATLNPALVTVGLARTIYNDVHNDTTQSSHIPIYLLSMFGRADGSGYPVQRCWPN